ncbi:CBM35 domain-containing protein [Streptomyces sp. NPDC051662]|uniref:fibronectin type III domain-containing protein n=1 Tax=Streptomyces sp. NPDC051662 TaxID=3154750 RepID=UPI0034488CBC
MLATGLNGPPTAAAATEPGTAQHRDTARVLAEKPYMGWSSWSLSATNYPGVNPDGPMSWMSERHILEQADVMASKLKKHGYEYINIDAGWTDRYDDYGRPAANPKTFPHGLGHLGAEINAKGLKMGAYLAVGLEPKAYADGKTPILGAEGCTTKDLVYPDLRTTNGWDSAYKIDYSNRCSQAYIDSVAQLLADQGVDFLKLDGVGPGSFKGGENYDNRADVKAWRTALDRTGRPIEFTLSWSLSHRYADTWKRYSNGYRIDTDVECYCDTLVTWDNSVKQRWHDVVQWIDDAGPGHWNNLDSVNVGNGQMDGLTKAERQSYMTLWAIEAAPLYIGDDLTKLDPYGLSLLTNDEVIAINQAGRPAKPVGQSSEQQTWYARNADGSYTVALFNLANAPASANADFRDLGISGAAQVRDVWSGTELGRLDGEFSAALPAHGSRLLRVTPRPDRAPTLPTGLHGTGSTPTSVSLDWDAVHPARGTTIDHYEIRDAGREVASVRSTSATITGLAAASGHTFTVVAVDSRGRASAPSAPVPVTTPGPAGPVTYEAEAGGNTLEGGASAGDCSGCSGGRKVGNLGSAGVLTFDGITAPRDGTYLVTVGYVDADSSRLGVVTVNGRKPFQLPFAGTGDNDWNTAQTVTVPVELKAGANTVRIANPTGYVADIDRITV